MSRSPIENVIRVLYREAAQHKRFSESWYVVQPRIAQAVGVWRMDYTLEVVK